MANLLGHANIQTTAIYAHKDKQNTKEVMEIMGNKIGNFTD